MGTFSPSLTQVGWRNGPPPNILQGPGDTSQPYSQGSIQRKESGSIGEASGKVDSQFLENFEGNVANNNNDQTNVNTVNNMNTAVQTNNNNVNVLDVILVGSPRVSHRPIG